MGEEPDQLAGISPSFQFIAPSPETPAVHSKVTCLFPISDLLGWIAFICHNQPFIRAKPSTFSQRKEKVLLFASWSESGAQPKEV